MVADSLVYHPSVAHYLRFVATTAGRDKLLRTLQYFSRFYAWYLFRTNASPGEIAPFNAIKKQFGLARKLMRVGKNIEHLKAAAVAADSKTLSPVVKYCAVGRQLGYAGYLSFDAVTYLDASGIRKFEGAKRLQKEAYRCWMVGLIFSAASGVYSLYNLRQQQATIDKKDGEGVVASKRIEKYGVSSDELGVCLLTRSRERAALNLQLVSDICDLAAPTSAIGLTNFDDGFVGLAGTVSSLIGVYSQWKKTA
ncbi:putative Peroxisomal membrane protein PMP27 [Venustampulla echinocandica]|uniref:Putative Peroxisomal membrane protein PMP27 n=1 Tax=Venustampulla echinocandica TaxID=2656787 RepID=A0A370TNJ1_9HELO|nr:putative Peroxisomal membrane protein PMP27 [Venustampulla echinocandica]RDL37089.1 putative Peroxisomal membrane protein PMP27 [Venustampulla echinocandica]